MRILIVPGDIDSIGCHRAIFPMWELQRHGVDAKFPPHDIDVGRNQSGEEHTRIIFHFSRLGSPDQFEFLDRIDPDLTVFSGPNDRAVADLLIPHLQSRGCSVVVDVDDWYGHKKVRQDVDYKPIFDAIRRADAFTTTTAHLAREYKRWNPKTFVLPNYTDWTLYQDVIPNSRKRRAGGRIRLGWMGGIQWGRSDDVLTIAGILPGLLERHPNLDVVVAGSSQATDLAFRLLGVPPERQVPLPTFGYHHRKLPEMLDFDIGLIPLRESRFNQGKSWLKALEYAAMGIPFVAAGWHPGYQEIVRRAPCGFLADSANDWSHYLELLVTQDANRRCMGRAGRRLAEKLTIQRHWWKWLQLYEEVNEWRRKPKPRLTSDLLLRAATRRPTKASSSSPGS